MIESPSRTSGRAWRIWTLASLCYLATLFGRMSLGVAAIPAQERFHIDATGLAVLSAVQLVVYLVLQIPAGIAADRIGPVRMLVGGLALIATGSLLFAIATTWPVAVAARMVLGLGDACMFVNVLRLLRGWFPSERYALVVSLTALVGGVGQLGATIPLSAGLHSLGWSATFALAAGLTLVLAGVAAIGLRPRAPMMVGFSSSDDENPTMVETGLRATLDTLRRDVVHSWDSAGTRHAFWAHAGLMGSFVVFSALWGYPYLVRAHGLPAGRASMFVAVVVASFTVASAVVGPFASRRPAARVRLIRAAFGVAALSWVALAAWPHAAGLALALPLAALGASGAVSMVAFDLVRTSNPTHRAGTATGVANVGGFAFAVIAELSIGEVLQTSRTYGLGDTTSFRIACALVVVMLAVSAHRLRTWASLSRSGVPRFRGGTRALPSA